MNGIDEQGLALDAAARARKLTETEIWLRRLAGTYRIDGTYTNSGGSNPISGTANCLGVGDGPAAPCVITATWKAPKEARKEVELDRALYSALKSMVILFGIDPDPQMPHIRFTLMDYRAVRMRALLVDGAVFSEGERAVHVFPPSDLVPIAQNALVPYFWQRILVSLRPGGDVVIKIHVGMADGINTFLNMLILQKPPGIEIDLRLQREPRTGVAQLSASGTGSADSRSAPDAR